MKNRRGFALALALALMFGSAIVAQPSPASAVPDLISVGDHPVRVEFSPDGSRFYVLNYGGKSVSAYATATRSPLFTTPTGGAPVAIDVSRDGTRIAVANQVTDYSLPDGGVTIINATTGAVLGTSPGQPATDVAYSPDSSRLYVIAVGQLQARDPWNAAYVRAIATPYGNAAGLTFAPDGKNLYVLADGGGELYRLRVADEAWDMNYAAYSYGGQVLLTPDGSRVVIPQSGSVSFVDLIRSDGRVVPGLMAGWGMVANPWGSRAYASNTDAFSPQIAVLDLGAEELLDPIVPAGESAGLAVTPSGTELWVALPDTDQVQVIPLPRARLGPEVEISRLQGANRYETAVEISRAFPTHVDTVFLASGEKFPDALGAAPAAIREGAVLLLSPRDALPTSVVTRIQELTPNRLVFLGSTASLSATVRAAAQAAAPSATVTEISGIDRFDTSRRILDEFFPDRDALFVATGLNFPDALSAGPVAGLVDQGILLLNGSASDIDAATEAVFETPDQVNHAMVIGGLPSVNAAVNYGIYAKTPASSDLQRINGGDRYTTAQNLNGRYFDSADVAYLASGLKFPDALAGAALAGHDGAPLYVVPSNCVPQRVIDDLVRLGVTKVVLLGSSASLDAGVESMTPCA